MYFKSIMMISIKINVTYHRFRHKLMNASLVPNANRVIMLTMRLLRLVLLYTHEI